MAGKLIVVGTPIGNLSDFSPRAIETLQTCDFIAAEDTRVTVKLLNHFGIKKPMVSYFEHNKMERGDIICNRMEQGEVCVLVSDAGLSLIHIYCKKDTVKCSNESGTLITRYSYFILT